MEHRGRNLLAVVCRNPETGPVKTRLIPALGEHGARALYRAFLLDLGVRFSAGLHDLLWAYTPEGGPLPDRLVPGQTLAQEGPDLGHRLLNLFRWSSNAGYHKTLVISSDVPHLTQGAIDAGFAALDRCDVVLAPSEDGGYHLVGMISPRDIFTMVPMSTPLVLARTREAIAAQRLAHHLIEGDFDVDLPEDLPRLACRLNQHPHLQHSHTARELRRLQGVGDWL